MNRALRGTLAVVAMCSLSACATTIVDTAPTTTLVPPTTVVPTGTETELFAQLQMTCGELSKAISDSNGALAKTKLAEFAHCGKYCKHKLQTAAINSRKTCNALLILLFLQ